MMEVLGEFPVRLREVAVCAWVVSMPFLLYGHYWKRGYDKRKAETEAKEKALGKEAGQ